MEHIRWLIFGPSLHYTMPARIPVQYHAAKGTQCGSLLSAFNRAETRYRVMSDFDCQGLS